MVECAFNGDSEEEEVESFRQLIRACSHSLETFAVVRTFRDQMHGATLVAVIEEATNLKSLSVSLYPLSIATLALKVRLAFLPACRSVETGKMILCPLWIL